jgi:hypothetical protein
MMLNLTGTRYFSPLFWAYAKRASIDKNLYCAITTENLRQVWSNRCYNSTTAKLSQGKNDKYVAALCTEHHFVFVSM